MGALRITTLWVIPVTLLVVGCGEASGTEQKTPITALKSPQTTLSVEAAKSFRFEWEGVEGATAYKLFANPDGLSGFEQVGDDMTVSHRSTVIELPLHQSVNAQFILQACNASSCVDGNTLYVADHVVDAIGHFKASNAGSNDGLGEAVSVSEDGTTLAVGAPYERSNAVGINGDGGDNSLVHAGAAYVFVKSDGRWIQEAYIKASNTELGDRFGSAVQLSADGSVLAVGAIFEDSGSSGVDSDQYDNSAYNLGAVYVYTRNAGAWVQDAYIKPDDSKIAHNFGRSISLSSDGHRLAVGSPSTGGSNVGCVYLFSKESEGWLQDGCIRSVNAESGDVFGHSVSLSGDGTVLAVGAVGDDGRGNGVNPDTDDSGITEDSGAVYVFELTDVGLWAETAYIKASAGFGSYDDFFGDQVSLSSDGTRLAVSAIGEDSGAVYVFGRSLGTWAQEAHINASNADPGDQFGYSLALNSNGNYLLVGGRQESSSAQAIGQNEFDNSASSAGAAYLYSRDPYGNWAQTAYLKSANTTEGGRFGTAVDLSGSGHTLAIGAPGEGSGGITATNETVEPARYSGALYLY